MRKSLWAIWGALLLLSCGRTVEEKVSFVPFSSIPVAWADSVAKQMSLEEKIRQLIIVRPDSPADSTASWLERVVQEHQAAGLWLSGWSEKAYSRLVFPLLDEASPLPPLIFSEYGLSANNQFSDLPAYPKTDAFYALTDRGLKEKIRLQRLEEYKLWGMNTGLFPFGKMLGQTRLAHFSSEDLPAEKEEALRYQSDLQAIHHLPVIQDLNPWKFRSLTDSCGFPDSCRWLLQTMMEKGLGGIMLPREFGENTNNLSPAGAVSLRLFLRDTLGFQGLLFAKYHKDGSLSYQLNSGVDAFVVSDSLAFFSLIQSWKEALEKGSILPGRLEESLRRMLRARRWIPQSITTETKNNRKGRSRVDHREIVRSLYYRSPVLLQNPEQLIPFREPARYYQLLEAGAGSLKTFRRQVGRYVQFRSRRLSPGKEGQYKALPASQYSKQNLIVVLGDQMSKERMPTRLLLSINQLSLLTEVAVVNFGDPAILSGLNDRVAVLQLFDQNQWTEEAAAQILFGGRQARGKMPYSLASSARRGQGAPSSRSRIGYGQAEDVGIARHKLTAIDAIVGQAIRKKAFPGAQVLVAHKGQIIYNKSFGHHTYDRKRAVRSEDVYDLASITKVAATTLLTMEAWEKNELKLSDRLKEHLPEEAGEGPIGNIQLKELLTHSSGLQPNMPVVPYLLHRNPRRDSFCNEWFCTSRKAPFDIPIAKDLYFNRQELDSIWQKVFELKARRRRKQRYSDVNMILMQKLLEEKSGKSMEELLYTRFYFPLGLRRLRYKPLDHFQLERIVPTQRDRRWRQQLVHGFVHDETAALFGGVAGNAGLFGNAEDLAILFQMLLQGGEYGGRKYLSPETIETFTTAPRGMERACGFEKPWSQSKSSCSGVASPATYGHTGFTGTSVWVDPDADLIYVFLSNRVHPDSRNWKINKLNVRRRIHNAIYDALDTYEGPQFLQDIPLSPPRDTSLVTEIEPD
jgi:beta-N-acetylhexosaminidase